jgi:hypothetical protein
VPLSVKVLDVALYALVLTAVFVLVGTVVGLVRGNGLVSAKYLLFWVGFLVLALGSWKLRPEPAWKDNPRIALRNSKRESPFQRLIYRVPPLSRYDLRREDLVSDGVKFLVAGVVMLATSAGMEFVLGI